MTREEQRGGGWEEIVKLCWSMYGFVCVVGDGVGARTARRMKREEEEAENEEGDEEEEEEEEEDDDEEEREGGKVATRVPGGLAQACLSVPLPYNRGVRIMVWVKGRPTTTVHARGEHEEGDQREGHV
ncbi:hypothetical protein WN51_00367 [Melipona quadrifasciata]|uniref:Uncharacterized protein n=1 Tax=Melipona quadrifasciata TaxID=166423 RepID=A0A0M8ZZH2_9HYME|nr:hypothetical protein WN51_00367 [Melipona quadrifasciata]